MRMNTGNTSVEQTKVDIPYIEIDDRYASITGSRILLKVGILEKDGIKNYIIERTKAGGYLMKK